jgi:ribosomal protein S18 acetylase RimI-like enzyme
MLRYAVNEAVTVEQFREVLVRSTLGERRPIEDWVCLRGMIEHANLMITAWDGALLVGVARSVTDFHYCCYLSDLAVDSSHQGRGIGRRLIELTQEALGPRCTLLLLSAPNAVGYYSRLGFTHHDQAWTLSRG